MNEDTILPETKKVILTAQEKLFRQQLKALGPIDNDTAKKIAQMIAGKIPEVGGIVSALIGIFWPNTEVSLWDQIKEQVEKMVDQKIAENNLQQLKDTLLGIHNAVSDYNELTDTVQRLQSLQAIDTIITSKVPSFVHGKPESAFSTFWGLALLHLTIRREIYNLRQDEANKKLLKNSVMVYCTFARVAFSRIYNDRINTVTLSATCENEPGKVSNLHIDVELRHSGGGLVSFHKLYRRGEWNDALINERTNYFNIELPKAWDNMVNGTKSDLNNWAFDAILLLEKEFPHTTQDGLKEIQKVLSDTEYKTFEQEYYPNESIYNSPVTSRTIIKTKDTRPKTIKL